MACEREAGVGGRGRLGSRANNRAPGDVFYATVTPFFFGSDPDRGRAGLGSRRRRAGPEERRERDRCIRRTRLVVRAGFGTPKTRPIRGGNRRE